MYIGILGFLVLYQHPHLMGRLACIILRYDPSCWVFMKGRTSYSRLEIYSSNRFSIYGSEPAKAINVVNCSSMCNEIIII